jgi:acyl-coenzyme A synthetase/AMP-(fatty) acid ligase
VYGLETSAIAALCAQCTLFDGKPFFPADVRAALTALDAPRTLVTTPVHLRALIQADIDFPPLARVVSATAPLTTDLAMRAEARWNTQVFEIYGCTEAGVVAHRRTVLAEPWQCFSGGTVHTSADAAQYRAAQLPAPVSLQDTLDCESPTRFHLQGRIGDMIKVAGKRASLQALTEQLLGVAGVRDAAMFMPQSHATEPRPAAVVAASISAAAILTALRERIDPVFLPRPLIVLDALPRSATGKLPRDVLLALYAQHQARSAGAE